MMKIYVIHKDHFLFLNSTNFVTKILNYAAKQASFGSNFTVMYLLLQCDNKLFQPP